MCPRILMMFSGQKSVMMSYVFALYLTPIVAAGNLGGENISQKGYNTFTNMIFIIPFYINVCVF